MKKQFENAVVLAVAMAMCSPAFAQLEKGTSMLTSVQTWILGVSVTVITIAFMWVGFRMAYQAAQWKDVAPIFWGGVLIGGAGGLASMLVG